MSDLTALQNKLDQRLKFLEQDPDNAMLFRDTLDLAITVARWETVSRLLERSAALLGDLATSNYYSVYYLAINRPDLALESLQPYLSTTDYTTEAGQVVIYNAAYACMLQNDYAAAKQLLQYAPIEALSDDSAGLFMNALMMEDNLELTLSTGDAYCRAGKQHPEVLGLYALALTDAGDFALAETICKRALIQAPNQHALCAMGMVLLGTQNAASAKSYFERTLQINQRYGRAWLGLGMCLIVEGNLDQAKEVLDQATHFNAQHPGSWHVLGWTHFAQGHLAEAEAAFNMALAADRNFGDTHGALAVVSLARGHAAEAEHHAEVALRLDPRSLAGHYAKALLAEHKGNPQKAETIIKGLLGSTLLNGESLANSVARIRRR